MRGNLFQKGFLRVIGMVQSLVLGQKILKHFFAKQVVGVVATCCLRAYEQQITNKINHSYTQGTKHT
jgi:hypothetical protein